jgi:hypothetical protein
MFAILRCIVIAVPKVFIDNVISFLKLRLFFLGLKLDF